MALSPKLVLFEDNRYLITHKPSGMPTAGNTLEEPGSLQYLVMQQLKRMVWAVHQLDRETSGVNVFVKRKSRVDSTAQALKFGLKEYLVIADALPRNTPDHFEINEPLMFLSGARRHGVHSKGKTARSEVHVVERSDDAALLRVRLHTGRTHQIRAHLAHLGIKLLGDHLYGGAECGARAPRQMLHAWHVALKIEELPQRKFIAPLPGDMREVLKRDFDEAAFRRILDMG